MTEVLKVANHSSLNDLKKNLDIGDLAYNEEDGKLLFWDGQDFKEYQGNLNLPLYDLNKQLMTQLPTYSFEDIQKSKDLIRSYVNKTADNFYLLLNHELKYITMFAMGQYTVEKIEDVVIECLNNVGKIKSIELTEDKTAIEVWVTVEKESYVMYFFKYGEGVELCS